MAKDVLEGNLRGVLSRLTPEEVNEDKLAFAEKLLEEAEHDLGKLGLTLDTMKIQNVWDERGYLDSIGRKQSAEIIKKSRIAEAKAKAKPPSRSRRRQPAARPDAAGRRRRADRRGPGRAPGGRRPHPGQGDDRRAGGSGERARLRAPRPRRSRPRRPGSRQVRRQLEADVIEPARAEMEAEHLRGHAAVRPRSSRRAGPRSRCSRR